METIQQIVQWMAEHNQLAGILIMYFIGSAVAIYFISNLTKKKYGPDVVMASAFLSWIFVIACLTATVMEVLKQSQDEYESIKRKYGGDNTDFGGGSDDK